MGETNSSMTDLHGQMRRPQRLMSGEEARAYLMQQHVAHVATIDAEGWPYVTPLVYIYEGGDTFYLHTGAEPGHFLANLRNNPRICLEVSEIGPLHPGRRFACNAALVYTSVAVWGQAANHRGPRTEDPVLRPPAGEIWRPALGVRARLSRHRPHHPLRAADRATDRQAQ